MVGLYGQVTLWVAHGVPHREGYTIMGGPWCVSYRRLYYDGWSMADLHGQVTLWAAHGVPHREGYTIMGGLWLTSMGRLRCGWPMECLIDVIL